VTPESVPGSDCPESYESIQDSESSYSGSEAWPDTDISDMPPDMVYYNSEMPDLSEPSDEEDQPNHDHDDRDGGYQAYNSDENRENRSDEADRSSESDSDYSD
jgi:hypothetical protein